MEKLYLVKLGKLYVTNTSSDSVTLKENAEKAKVFANELEAENLANILGAQLITFVLEGQKCLKNQEECAELIQAITKVKRYGFRDKYEENLHEEVADVLICISELLCLGYLDIDKVAFYHKIKIAREIERAIQKEKIRKDIEKYGNCE